MVNIVNQNIFGKKYSYEIKIILVNIFRLEFLQLVILLRYN